MKVRPKEISNVSPGFTFTEESPQEGVESITFSVPIEFHLLLENYDHPLFYRTFQLSSLKNLKKERENEISTAVVVAIHNIAVEATISMENDHYSDLELLRVIT